MCIRDRYNTYHEQKQRYAELQTVKRNIDQILRRSEPQRRKEQSHEPVSYTHLDVYKRQMIITTNLKLAELKNPPDLAHARISVSYTHLDVYKRQALFPSVLTIARKSL